MPWTHTYDVNTPAGSDDPKEGDDRIREVKAALQERLAQDHYFPKDGSEVSDTDAGEHKKVTLRVGSAPTKADDKGFLYAKNVSEKAELFYIDEDDNEVQLTSGGKIAASKMYQATGTSNINSGSTTYVDIADMSITETFKAGKIFISFNTSIRLSSPTGDCFGFIAILVGGVIKKEISMHCEGDAGEFPTTINWVETLTAGEHTIKIQWHTSATKSIIQDGASLTRTLNIITSN